MEKRSVTKCASCRRWLLDQEYEPSQVRGRWVCRECETRRAKTARDKREGFYARLAVKYKLTHEEISQALKGTNGMCPVCLRQFRRITPTEPAMDHDHKTGRPRGFICAACNRGLGDFRDDTAALRRAAEYLEIARVP